MLPTDWQGDDPADARAYLQTLKRWEHRRDELVAVQAAARTSLDTAQARLSVLEGWVADLDAQVDSFAARRQAYDTCTRQLSATTAAIDTQNARVADLVQSSAIATSRLLGDIPCSTPIVLLPLRVETHWTERELLVRIFPDEIGVDSHDERLTAAEQAAGTRYWQCGSDPASTLQAWEELVRQTGATRAAWVARVCDPARPTPELRPSAWDTRIYARLLPDRFAVVAVADAMLHDLGTAGAPSHVTWGAPIEPSLDFVLFAQPDSATWLTDFEAAVRAGMAVRVPLREHAAPIEALLVVGVRSDPAPDLGSLLTAHSFSSGLEILSDGAPTNNSDDVRAATGRQQRSEAARLLVDRAGAAEVPPPGSAGEQLSTLLGVDAAILRGIRGAHEPRATAQGAMALLVQSGVRGVLRDSLGQGANAWSVVSASGPGPTLRIGHQPYGVLPATAVGRWLPQPNEIARPLAETMSRWALANGPSIAIDPLDRPVVAPGGGTTRAASQGETNELATLTLERPESLRWQGESTTFVGLDGLVGAAQGEGSPASYLLQIAAAEDDQLAALRVALPALLAQVAIAAKQSAANDVSRAWVDASLQLLAAEAARQGQTADGRRDALARLLSATLDVHSHRFDGWITGAVSERLRKLRDRQDARRAVGAYGWLTDLRPAPVQRSQGHVLAPSLAHAATAAVLRAGYVGERTHGEQDRASRQAMAVDLSSARVRAALSAVRAGQPLAAVLGRAFEDNLVSAGLQRYLATFRKLTRFRTGSALSGFEQAQRVAKDALAASERELHTLREQATVAATKLEVVAALRAAAEEKQAAAQAQADPYLAMQARVDRLIAVVIPQLSAALAEVDAARPTPGVHSRKITVPDP